MVGDAGFVEIDATAFRRAPVDNAALVRSLVARVAAGIDPSATARKALDLRRNHWK